MILHEPPVKCPDFDLFDGLKPADLTAVFQQATQHRYESGSFVFYQGEPANTFYFLQKGSIRMTQMDDDGHQIIVHFFTPGNGVGVIAALGQFNYPLSAEAVEDCLLFAWDKKLMARLMEQYPRIAVNTARILAERFKELQDRYRELATERVEQRIARTLLRLIQQMGKETDGGILIDMPLARRDLAEMTGTTIFSVSRVVSNWEQKKLVQTKREQITICSSQALAAIAEDLPAPES